MNNNVVWVEISLGYFERIFKSNQDKLTLITGPGPIAFYCNRAGKAYLKRETVGRLENNDYFKYYRIKGL